MKCAMQSALKVKLDASVAAAAVVAAADVADAPAAAADAAAEKEIY